MSTVPMPTHSTLRLWLETADALCQEELLRPADNEFRAFYLDHAFQRKTVETIRGYVRESPEWQEKHQPAPPVPVPPPTPSPSPGSRGALRAYGMRAVADDNGPTLMVGLSRFYWLWAWKHDRDRVLREMDADRAAGYGYARVFAQVQNLCGDHYWDGREIDPAWPGHTDMVHDLTKAAAVRGLRLLWTLIGKGGQMGRQTERLDFVHRMAETLHGSDPAGILCAEMMNEPGMLGDINSDELRYLDSEFGSLAPGLLHATGAVWTDAGWCADDPGYQGATAFSVEGWERTQNPSLGIAHLDRSAAGNEGTDRAWRQGWDVGLQHTRWIDNEPIGPGASVATENRPDVLRSHRAVAFICRAFATCYHCDAGIRGFGSVEDSPGYRECPKATRFLPGDVVNGRPVNANQNYPDRHFDLPAEYLRAETGRGIVRAYAIQHEGKQYTIPFGPVSGYRLIATRPLRVSEYHQQNNERTWQIELGRGDDITFDASRPDRLVVSEAL